MLITSQNNSLSNVYIFVSIEAHQFVNRKSYCNCWIARAIHNFLQSIIFLPILSAKPGVSSYLLLDNCAAAKVYSTLVHAFINWNNSFGERSRYPHKKQEAAFPKQKSVVIFWTTAQLENCWTEMEVTRKPDISWSFCKVGKDPATYLETTRGDEGSESFQGEGRSCRDSDFAQPREVFFIFIFFFLYSILYREGDCSHWHRPKEQQAKVHRQESLEQFARKPLPKSSNKPCHLLLGL